MSEHGRVILDRMLELVVACEAGRIDPKALVEQLQSMYDSLDPAEQPIEREWLDGIIPLDRAMMEGPPSDRRRIEAQVRDRLAHLKRTIVAGRPAA